MGAVLERLLELDRIAANTDHRFGAEEPGPLGQEHSEAAGHADDDDFISAGDGATQRRLVGRRDVGRVQGLHELDLELADVGEPLVDSELEGLALVARVEVDVAEAGPGPDAGVEPIYAEDLRLLAVPDVATADTSVGGEHDDRIGLVVSMDLSREQCHSVPLCVEQFLQLCRHAKRRDVRKVALEYAAEVAIEWMIFRPEAGQLR